ncbi:MAG: DNA polymerase III subunit gamma/tau [Patescibacteria group bacterium]|nr:DNA polymerase III subunit gamma/tau [Patescibacteria group bacterium]MDD3435381.1 DNA polymerase III subunit gamma/tau [Patescibacteria group bacterium]MDD4466631.1 DNA polymerase III subunit gamma/tau [Patescibacteria group bacterium]
MSTLYRDYRPKNFSEVLGQNHVKIALQNEILAGSPANAYLFCGPRAVGKTTVARILAKSLNCENRQSDNPEPCNQCNSCQSIAQGNDLDVVEIDAASNTGVDNVRENIIAFSRVVATKNRYRIFIIDEVHMLSINSWNALLKTLEEPPLRVIFVLCTTEIHKVPETIISRCERFDFKRIPLTEVIGKLRRIVSQEKVAIEDEVLEAIARQAGGHLRDAESLLGQVLSLGEAGKKISWEQAELVVPRHHHDEALELIKQIINKDVVAAIKLVNQAADSGLNLKNIVNEVLEVLRKILLYQASPKLADNYTVALDGEAEIAISEIAAQTTPFQITAYLEGFLELFNDKLTYTVPQLPLEIKIISLLVNTPKATPTPPSAAPVRPNRLIASAKDASPLPPETSKKPMAADLSSEDIKARWPEFLARVKSANHSLSFVLQNCVPGPLEKGELPLTFKYKFHKERIGDPQIKPNVEKILAEVYGGLIKTVLSIDDKLILNNKPLPVKESAPAPIPKKEKEPVNNDNLLDNLLQTFGGEVIS